MYGKNSMVVLDPASVEILYMIGAEDEILAIPDMKNIKPICGKPLVYWTVKAACECKYIDTVYVATDSDKIKEVSLRFKEEDPLFHKLQVIGRSAESASDTASTESAMLEFADKGIDFINLRLPIVDINFGRTTETIVFVCI